MKKQKKEDIIWASGRHLTTYLPDNFDKWPHEKLYSFIEDNIANNTSVGIGKMFGQKFVI